MGKKIGATILVGMMVMLGFAATASARECNQGARAEIGQRAEYGRRAAFERRVRFRHEQHEHRFGRAAYARGRYERMPERRVNLKPGAFRFYRGR